MDLVKHEPAPGLTITQANAWFDEGVPCRCGGRLFFDTENSFFDEDGMDAYPIYCSSYRKPPTDDAEIEKDKTNQ